jgi:tetratricopeptide (TPR) repeat protein
LTIESIHFFMLKKIIIIVFIFSTQLLLAQEQYVTRKTVTGKAKDFFEQGKKAFVIGDMKNAIKLLDKAIEKEPTFIDAYFQKAVVYGFSGKLVDAEMAFEKALSISTTYEPEAIFSLAENERKQKKEGEAIAHYQQYLDAKTKNQDARLKSKGYIEQLDFIAAAKKNPVPFKPIPLNNTINTIYAKEYFPCLTADGEKMASGKKPTHCSISILLRMKERKVFLPMVGHWFLLVVIDQKASEVATYT